MPVTRAAPSLYRWRVRSRIYRVYGALMAIEREMMAKPTARSARRCWRRAWTRWRSAVNDIKTPLSYADQLYVLREHVSMVRRRLRALTGEDLTPIRRPHAQAGS